MSKVIERAARELSVPSEELNNSKVKMKVGATEKRNAPSTIYIQISFWTTPSKEHLEDSNKELHSILEDNINSAYAEFVEPLLKENFFFTKPKENITIWNIPDNLNYNSKRNYISLELYLHTLNTSSSENYALHYKKDRRLYEAALEISNNFVSSDFFQGKKGFDIFKTASKD